MEANVNASWTSFDINIEVAGKVTMGRFFVPTKVYCKDANGPVEITTKVHEATHVKDMAQFTGYVTHAIKSVGVKQDQIVKALATPPTNVTDWMEIMLSLVPRNFKEVPVDVFLEWQNTFSGEATVTFLRLPKNMKTGRWITPARPGTFVEVLTTKSLTYVNENDKEHDISRDASFIDGECFTQKREGQEAEEEDTAAAPFKADTSASDDNDDWG